ncbi:MAG: hypothetical protein JJU46_07925 [Balneolaceae bacterium]|nr:hypothetical protein [Balneolaceae bacterium]MCH8548466.1 hypothetical protein [Balneolaceae bacterium]
MYRLCLLICLCTLFAFSGCDTESVTGPGDNGDVTDPGSVTLLSGSGTDRAETVIRTSDGGTLIAGTTNSDDGDFSGLALGNYDIFLLKLSANGSREWLQTYGGDNSDWAMDVIEDSGGNFVVTGYTRSNTGTFSDQNLGENDIFLLKTDPNGDLLFAQTYGGSDEDYGHAVIEAPGGGYLITGASRSTDQNFSGRNNSSMDIFLMRTDVNGIPSFIQAFGGTSNDEGMDLAITQNNTAMITGRFSSSDGDFSGGFIGDNSAFVIEIELNGAPRGLTTYGGTGSDVANSIAAASDGGVVIAGRTNSTDGHFENRDNSSNDMFLMKLNAGRDIEWLQTFGGSRFDSASSVIQLQSEDYLIAGESQSNDGDFDGQNLGGHDAVTVLVSPDGSPIRISHFGGSRSDMAFSVTELLDGNLGISGWTQSTDGDFEARSGGNPDAFFLISDLEGNVQ